jgi:hypothetical protein
MKQKMRGRALRGAWSFLKGAARSACSVLLAGALILPAGAVGAGPAVYKNSRKLADNFEYVHTISHSSAMGRQESHTLKILGNGDVHPLFLGGDTIYGGLTIDQILAHAESLGLNVIAAVNSDFYSMQNGVPLGLVVENGVYKSSPSGRNAVAVLDTGEIHIARSPSVSMTLTNLGGGENYEVMGQSVTVDHFNKYRTDTGGLYIFSSAFSTVSTRTPTGGCFVRFEILEGTPKLHGTMLLEVAEITEAPGDFPIGDEYLVLSASSISSRAGELSKFSLGDRVLLETVCSDERLATAQWASGGGDILIENGAITDQTQWDKDILAAHPRTAFGIKADGTIVTYVMDGRNNSVSSGLKLKDLADELLAQGCIDAINLDGGGSSVMSIRVPTTGMQKVINAPSDGAPRKCGSYLLFVTDKKPDGYPKHLTLLDEGAVLLTGATLALNYTAQDAGYKPVTAPEDVFASSTTGYGTVENGMYKAGPKKGTDRLSFSSPSTGASGTGSFFIIDTPTELSVKLEGGVGTLKSLTLWAGDSVRIVPRATYYGKNVVAAPNNFTYSVSEEAQSWLSVSEDGVVTVSETATSGLNGAVTVQAGSAMVTIDVFITGFDDAAGHWGRDFIRALHAAGIVKGQTDTLFGSENTIIRADFVLMLHRAAGAPQVEGMSSFTDVAPEAYYAAAIAWAEQAGIALGTGDGLFNPTGTLTREQAFTLVHRAFDVFSMPKTEGSQADLALFSDAQSIADYAVVPTATLVKMGIVSGAGGAVMPKSGMTRAQMAKVLYSVLNYNSAHQP